jgi:hypothetical protein
MLAPDYDRRVIGRASRAAEAFPSQTQRMQNPAQQNPNWPQQNPRKRGRESKGFSCSQSRLLNGLDHESGLATYSILFPIIEHSVEVKNRPPTITSVARTAGPDPSDGRHHSTPF